MTLNHSEFYVPQSLTTLQVVAFYRDGVDSESAQAANAAIGARFVRALTVGDAALLAVPQDRDVDEVLEQLRSQPGVVEASRDYQVVLLKR